MNVLDLKCDACGFETQHAATMNRHLINCEKYDEWIKDYKPPKEIICRGCCRGFINEKVYHNHVYECYIKDK